MTRQNISIGTLANDGTGDTFRAAMTKVNDNFIDLYTNFGGDSDILSTKVNFDSAGIVFEGASLDSNQTRLYVVDPTTDNTIRLPDASGTVVLNTNTQTITNKTLTQPFMSLANFYDSADSSYLTFKIGNLTGSHTLNFPTIADSDTVAYIGLAQTLTNKTLDSATINNPVVSGYQYDTNGANMFSFTATASAVNHFTFTNNTAGQKPIMSVQGTDSDITMQVDGKNGGPVQISKLARKLHTLTANGAVPPEYGHIDCNKGTALALTLANGVIAGEEKVFSNRGAGTATVTPASFAHGTSFALAQNESCICTWDGNSWFISGNYSVVTIA